MSVPVDPSCKYDNLPSFAGFVGTIQFVGGINKPKLVQCVDRCTELLIVRRRVGCDMQSNTKMEQQHFSRSAVVRKKPCQYWRHFICSKSSVQ
jgi:hypothetical protein